MHYMSKVFNFDNELVFVLIAKKQKERRLFLNLEVYDSVVGLKYSDTERESEICC